MGELHTVMHPEFEKICERRMAMHRADTGTHLHPKILENDDNDNVSWNVNFR
jgi:hypothetical protein